MIYVLERTTSIYSSARGLIVFNIYVQQTFIPPFIKLPEPRAQTQDRSVRDDSDTRARRVGGLPPHGAQAAVVQHRRCAGAARLAQAHSAPLSATVTPL